MPENAQEIAEQGDHEVIEKDDPEIVEKEGHSGVEKNEQEIDEQEINMIEVVATASPSMSASVPVLPALKDHPTVWR